MLRRIMREDGPAVVELVVAAGMFTRAEAGLLDEALVPAEGTTCLVEDADDGRGLASVVLYRPEEAADRVFDLTMIAVRPDLQGEGRGSALMRHVEQNLREQDQRMLLIRTSGTARYDQTRAFYKGLGYSEHARVPDYWTDGDDLVLFTTRL
jgi:ribosomal protein S18 acetylase RimI-like enzyme